MHAPNEIIFSLEVGDVVPGEPLPSELLEALLLIPKGMRIQIWGLDAYRVNETVAWLSRCTGRSAAPSMWPIVLKTGGKFKMIKVIREGKSIWVAESTADPSGWQDICDRLEQVASRGYQVGLDGESTITSAATCPERWTPFMGVALRDGRTVRQHIESLPELWVYPGSWMKSNKGFAQYWSRSFAPLSNVRVTDEMFAQELQPESEMPGRSLRSIYAAWGQVIRPPLPIVYLIESGLHSDLNWGWRPSQWKEACALYPADTYLLYPMRHNCVEMARLLAAEYDGWQAPPAIQMTEVSP